MNRPLRLLGIGAAALLLASTAASAATYTNSFDTGLTTADASGVASVQKFDTSLGTLTGVSWQVVLDIEGTLELTNIGETERTGEANTQTTFSISAWDPGPLLWDFQLEGGTQQLSNGTGNITLSPGEATGVLDISDTRMFSGAVPGSTLGNDLSLWEGPGNVSFAFSTNTLLTLGFGGGNFDAQQLTDVRVRLDVTYTFEPNDIPPGVIPLPAAGWMLLSGIAGLGGIGWMRRRTNG